MPVKTETNNAAISVKGTPLCGHCDLVQEANVNKSLWNVAVESLRELSLLLRAPPLTQGGGASLQQSSSAADDGTSLCPLVREALVGRAQKLSDATYL